MDKTTLGHDVPEGKIPFRIHPRIFAALGADLVTNDIVAVIELVKNSYDAFSQNIWVRFRHDAEYGDFIEIQDDGTGMTRDIIENVWCLVATPYKELNPYAKSGKGVRRVAGEKGLGRLSAARLGSELYMLTKAEDNPCWEVSVDWDAIATGEDLSESFAICRQYQKESPFSKTGTLLRIYSLKSQWDDGRIVDLEENLARLVSPFSDQNDFNIYLSSLNSIGTEEVKIQAPEFLSKPKYCIRGEVDSLGNILGKYSFTPIKEGMSRENDIRYSWSKIYKDIIKKRIIKPAFQLSQEKAHCGPFEYEIRAWDIASEDTKEISETFNMQKSNIRDAIRTHKGISIYRDGILVLPKSDNARDWLGLDLRRISKVGNRLSTSQVVGYVSISADKNERIEDTSDRERLVSRKEVSEFETILLTIVYLLENERDIDRVFPEREKPMNQLFDELSAEELVSEVEALSKEGADIKETLPMIRAFSNTIDTARQTIQERFVYYSRLATIGTIAHMLVHEIRNRTTAIGSFLELVKDRYGPFKDKSVASEYRRADSSITALEHLSDLFSPLASRSFKRKKRSSILEKQIRESISLSKREIERKNINVVVPDTETKVAVDPGELDAILLNLILNSVYWLEEVPKEKRQIMFEVVPLNEGRRIQIWVHDTGPGVAIDDIDKIFWPGVTRKVGGIGMGLTVAAELIAAYGGSMSTMHPGKEGGASFSFDLPVA